MKRSLIVVLALAGCAHMQTEPIENVLTVVPTQCVGRHVRIGGLLYMASGNRVFQVDSRDVIIRFTLDETERIKDFTIEARGDKLKPQDLNSLVGCLVAAAPYYRRLSPALKGLELKLN